MPPTLSLPAWPYFPSTSTGSRWHGAPPTQEDNRAFRRSSDSSGRSVSACRNGTAQAGSVERGSQIEQDSLNPNRLGIPRLGVGVIQAAGREGARRDGASGFDVSSGASDRRD